MRPACDTTYMVALWAGLCGGGQDPWRRQSKQRRRRSRRSHRGFVIREWPADSSSDGVSEGKAHEGKLQSSRRTRAAREDGAAECVNCTAGETHRDGSWMRLYGPAACRSCDKRFYHAGETASHRWALRVHCWGSEGLRLKMKPPNNS